MGDRDASNPAEHSAYVELQAHTLGLRDPAFVHQHVVDAWAAQHADRDTRPIGLTFALVGLYLHVEKGRSGREVQQVHMQLSRRRRDWPSFPLPVDRGTLTAADVLASPAGPGRVQAIDAWCASVWAAFAETRPAVEDLLRQHGVR